MLSDIEQEVQMMRANGYASDKNMRCDILESILESKMFLMQAKVDSLTVNQEMVMANLNQRMDGVRTSLGGDDKVEEYFGKPVYKLRQEWQELRISEGIHLEKIRMAYSRSIRGLLKRNPSTVSRNHAEALEVIKKVIRENRDTVEKRTEKRAEKKGE